MAVDYVKVYVGNLNKDVDENALKQLFTDSGFNVQNVTLKQLRGFGFIDLSDEETAKQACESLNGKEHHGQTIVVEKSDPKSRRKNNLTNKVRVVNVPLSVDRDQIAQQLGELQITDYKQVSKNDSAQIIELGFESSEGATQAYNKLSGLEHEGQTYRVNYQYDSPRRGMGYNYNRYNRGGPMGMKGPRAQQQNPDLPLRVLIPSEMVGAVIGKKGGTISQITKESKAKIDVNRQDPNTQSLEKPVTISGSPEAQTTALQKIYNVMQSEAKEKGKPEVKELKILAHDSLVGRLIGKQGANLKKIMEESNSKIAISSQQELNLYNMERTITVKSENTDGMFQAQDEILKKLRASYEKDMMYIISACEPAYPMMPPPSYQPPYPSPYDYHHPHPHHAPPPPPPPPYYRGNGRGGPPGPGSYRGGMYNRGGRGGGRSGYRETY